MNTYSTPWTSQLCWQLTCVALVPGHALKEPTRPSCFSGNCLVSYGVSVGCQKSDIFLLEPTAVFFSAGRVTFDNMAGTLRDCACQKWAGFTAKDIDSCKHYAHYATVHELAHGNFCYSWWRSHLLFGFLSTRCCATLMSAVMFEEDVWVNGHNTCVTRYRDLLNPVMHSTHIIE